MQSYIKEQHIVTRVGPSGLPAYSSNEEKCQYCGHNEFEVLRGGGVTEVYCCKCQKLTRGG